MAIPIHSYGVTVSCDCNDRVLMILFSKFTKFFLFHLLWPILTCIFFVAGHSVWNSLSFNILNYFKKGYMVGWDETTNLTGFCFVNNFSIKEKVL